MSEPSGDSSSCKRAGRPRSDSEHDRLATAGGWHSRGYLPHSEFRRIQFITYRLFDSVPQERVLAWKRDLAITDATAPNAPESQELRRRIELYADAGHGSCFLQDPRVARLVRDNLLHFDTIRYRLLDWCIMPNHVHVLVEPSETWSLSRIVHTWRSYTAHEANRILGRTGAFWFPEYFDRYIRNEDHLRRTIAYIDANPRNAYLPDWPWSHSASRFPLSERGRPAR